MKTIRKWALGFGLAFMAIIAAPVLAPVGGGAAWAADEPSLAGSRWGGVANWGEERNVWTAYFRSDGVLEYGYKGKTYTNGRWQQRNKLTIWNTNDYYAIYIGTLTGDSMSGVMYNRNGARGVWSFQRSR